MSAVKRHDREPVITYPWNCGGVEARTVGMAREAEEGEEEGLASEEGTARE